MIVNGKDSQLEKGIELSVETIFSGLNGVTATEMLDYTIIF
jgi:hypothetical protein